MASIIVAVAKNGVIGNKGSIPWKLPPDMKRFKYLTTEGGAVIMGRKTHEAIGCLENRLNVVLTKNRFYKAPGCLVTDSVDTALQNALHHQETFIIGGGEIYTLTLPIAERIYLTRVFLQVEGDAFFPDPDPQEWVIKHRELHFDPQTGIRYDYETYERKKK